MTNAEPLLTSSIIYIITQCEFFTYCMEHFAVLSIQSIFIKLDFLTTFAPFYGKFQIGLERKMHVLKTLPIFLHRIIANENRHYIISSFIIHTCIFLMCDFESF